ncbi:MAG: hypothetical protein AAGI89_14530 [Pseudomonadota bacterium]
MDQPEQKRSLPWWLWCVVVIEVAVPTYFGAASIIDPGIWGAASLGTLGQLYVTRNFAMAFGVAIAALKRSHVALLCTIAVRYVTDLTDITASFVRGVDPETMPVLLVFALLLLVLPLFALGWLARRPTH